MARLQTLFDAVAWPRDFDLPVLVNALDLSRALNPFGVKRLQADSPALGSLLSCDPPVFALRPSPRPFGAAPYFAERYPNVSFVFLVTVAWSLEAFAGALALAIQVRRFRRAYPRCRLVVLANTDKEQERLAALGVEAHVASHLAFIDENLFRPLPGRERRFDALCNARLAPYKRHELAQLVPTCAHITMISGFYPERLKRERLNGFVDALPPGHTLLNRREGDRLIGIDFHGISEACASAHVGLCLSRVEGAMNASIEYLLCGLPVVSTPSLGGRDRFFHPDTTLMAPADPRSIRDAVAAMKARDIPPEAVRATTLAMLTRERDRFSAFVESLGVSPVADDPRFRFPFYHRLTTDNSVAGLERRWRTRSPHGVEHHVLNAASLV